MKSHRLFVGRREAIVIRTQVRIISTTEDEYANVANQARKDGGPLLSGTHVGRRGSGGRGTIDHRDESDRQSASYRTEGDGTTSPESRRQDRLPRRRDVQRRRQVSAADAGMDGREHPKGENDISREKGRLCRR